MKASEIAKIENLDEQVAQVATFLFSFGTRNFSQSILFSTLFVIATDILFQRVSEITIIMANNLWEEYDKYDALFVGIELPSIIKLIANHNPDFQPGEEAFVLLDEMVSVEA